MSQQGELALLIQNQQKADLLSLLSSQDLAKLAERNNITGAVLSSPKEELIVALIQLSGTCLLNGIGKGYLTVYLAKHDISGHKYVNQMREAVQEFWIQQRLSLLTQNTVKPEVQKEEEPPTAPTEHRAQENNSVILREQQEAAMRSQTNVNTTSSSLADQFCVHFYTLLHGANPQEIITSGMFSQHAIAYLFLFSPAGDVLMAEKKVEGIQEISAFISLLAKYRFSPGSCSEEQDDFGNLQIVVKGNIVVEQDKCVGIYTHFYKFFKPDLHAKYIIREASFHMKTIQQYQPLRNIIPYKVLEGYK